MVIAFNMLDVWFSVWLSWNSGVMWRVYLIKWPAYKQSEICNFVVCMLATAVIGIQNYCSIWWHIGPSNVQKRRWYQVFHRLSLTLCTHKRHLMLRLWMYGSEPLSPICLHALLFNEAQESLWFSPVLHRKYILEFNYGFSYHNKFLCGFPSATWNNNHFPQNLLRFIKRW